MIKEDKKKIKQAVGWIEWTYAGLLFLLPIAFAFWLSTENMFQLPKQVVFRSALALLLVLFFCYAIRAGRLPRLKNKTAYYLSAGLAVLFAVNIFVSHDALLSFFGKYGREQGLLSLLHYLLFFVVSLFLLPLIDNWRKIWLALLSGSWLVMIYGYLQYFGLDPISWVGEARIFSTLGQPNFYGYYLVLILPLAFYYFLAEPVRRLKMFAGITVAGQIISLFLTMSRGALLGFLAASLFLFMLLLWRKGHSKLMLAVIIISFLFPILLIVSQKQISNFESSSPVFNRAVSAFDISSVSASIRFEFWQAGWQIFQNSSWSEKVFGYGKEYQQRLYYHYYEPDWGYLDKANRIPDRAHNLIIDIWLEFGLLGLVIFAAFNLYVFWAGLAALIRRRSVSGDGFWLIACLLALMIVYFVSNMFGFPMTTHYAVYYFALALLLVTVRGNDLSWLKIKSKNNNIKIIAASVALLYIIQLILFTYSYALADVKLAQAKQYEQKGNYPQAVRLADKAQNLYGFSTHYISQSLRLYGRAMLAGQPAKNQAQMLERAGEYEAVWRQNQSRKNLAQNLARFYSLAGKVADDKYLGKAEAIYRQLLAEDPAFDYLYADYASLLMIESKPQQALPYIQKAIELLPDPERQPVPFNREIMEIKEGYEELLKNINYFYKN